MLGFLVDVIIQGLLYGVMSMGVLLSYKILDFPDLSVDGSFPLGAAVSAILIINGVNPWLALLVSVIAGCIAGFITGFLHVKLGIEGLMSGILVMTGLYSVNLMVAGGSFWGSKSNLPLFNYDTLFSFNLFEFLNLPPILQENYKVFLMIGLVLLVKFLIDWILKTKLGYLMRVTGDNASLVTSLGHSVGRVKIFGLALSNGVVALSGGLAASVGRYFDASLGTGMIVLGLSSVILGTTLLRKVRVKETTKVIVGAIAYRLIVALAIKQGLEPQHMRLMTVIIFIGAILLNKGKLSNMLRIKTKEAI